MLALRCNKSFADKSIFKTTPRLKFYIRQVKQIYTTSQLVKFGRQI